MKLYYMNIMKVKKQCVLLNEIGKIQHHFMVEVLSKIQKDYM